MSLPRRLIVPKRHPDERGWFAETFHEARLRALGIDCRFVQDNQSYSQRAATLRGLHFQAPPFEQAKLISVLRGRVFDVAVDVRRGSPTFGQHVSAELSTETGRQLYIPARAHQPGQRRDCWLRLAKNGQGQGDRLYRARAHRRARPLSEESRTHHGASSNARQRALAASAGS